MLDTGTMSKLGRPGSSSPPPATAGGWGFPMGSPVVPALAARPSSRIRRAPPARHELRGRHRRRAAPVAYGALRQRARAVRRRQAAARHRGRRGARALGARRPRPGSGRRGRHRRPRRRPAAVLQARLRGRSRARSARRRAPSPQSRLSDTLKREGERGAVSDTVDRAGLWAAQTPQVFRADALRDVYARTDLNGATDDAMLLERAGYCEPGCRRPPNANTTTWRTFRWPARCSPGGRDRRLGSAAATTRIASPRDAASSSAGCTSTTW